MIRKLLIALLLWIAGEFCYRTFSGAPVAARLKLAVLEPIFVVAVVLAAWLPVLNRRVRISAVMTIILLLAIGSRYQN